MIYAWQVPEVVGTKAEPKPAVRLPAIAPTPLASGLKYIWFVLPIPCVQIVYCIPEVGRAADPAPPVAPVAPVVPCGPVAPAGPAEPLVPLVPGEPVFQVAPGIPAILKFHDVYVGFPGP